jgi:hypothetical protein
MPRWVPLLPLYRVQGQDAYKAIGSPDRGITSLREGLANLACKLRRLVELVRAWLSSWSCSHVEVWCGVVLQCWSWRHCRHNGGSPAILCDVVSTAVFVIVS